MFHRGLAGSLAGAASAGAVGELSKQTNKIRDRVAGEEASYIRERMEEGRGRDRERLHRGC